MISFDEFFCHDYECEPISAPPKCGVSMYCYPGAISGGWVEGVGIHIIPHSSTTSWVGSFAYGDLSPNAVTGVFSLPSRTQVMVASRGDVHVVNVNNPKEYYWVKEVLPVMGVVPMRHLNRMLLFDFTRIVAIDDTGVVWRTNRLSWDGIKSLTVNDDRINGVGWDAPNDREVQFEVDASTGEVRGEAIEFP